MKQPIRFLLLMLLSLFFKDSLFAVEMPLDSMTITARDSISLLEAVVIKAQKRRESIIPPQTIDAQQLQKLNSHSIADAMRYFSGVQVKDYGGVGGIKTINLRSMGSQHVGIFYDGVELGNAQNGQIDLGQYSLSNMESIELYNGQKGGTLQPAKDFGSSGTVYLRTRKPTFINGQSYQLRIGMKGGSFGLANPSLVWEKKLGRFTALSLSTEYLYATGKYRFRYRRTIPETNSVAYDTTAVRQNGDINAARVEATLFGGSSNLKYTLKSYNYFSNRGIPGAIVNNVWRRGERITDENHFAQAIAEARITEKYRLKAISKYAYYYTHYINRDPTLLQIDNRFHQEELYFSLAQSLSLSSHWHISLAYDYLWNRLRSDIRDFVFPWRHTNLVALSSTYSSSQLEIQGSLLGSFICDYARFLNTTPRYGRVAPALLVSYSPWKRAGLRVDAFCKGSFRMPTFNDLYYTDVGNSKLKPEETRQYSLTLNYGNQRLKGFWKGVNVTLGGYYNRVKNKIVAYPKGQQFRWTMLNLGEVDIRGLESSMMLLIAPFRQFETRLHLQYTYQRAIDITDKRDSYFHHQIPYIPKHSGSVSLGCSYKTWQLNYCFVYVGERYNQRENTIYNYTQPWYTSDLSLSYDLTFLKKNNSLRILLECNNIFNQQYEVILNYPMPGTNFKISLLWQI